MATFIIEDWMGKHCWPEKTFDSFEAARDFISEHANIESSSSYPDEEDEEMREAAYDGICEDLYAIEINEEGEKV